MNITILKNRHRPLYKIDDKIITYHFGYLYSSLDGVKFNKNVRIPESILSRFLSRLRFFERLLRSEPRCAAYDEINQKLYVSHNGRLDAVDLENRELFLSIKYRPGMHSPLAITKISGINGFSDCLVYGEYFGNNERDSVSIFLKELGSDTWKTAYTFPPGTIRHIHNIIPDPIRSIVYILTGDLNNESGFWCSRNNFKTVEKIIIGSQDYRSCLGVPNDKGVLFVTDSPMTKNSISQLNLETPENSVILSQLSSPAIYGCVVNNYLIFSSSIEPCETVKFPWKLFTRKLGTGITDAGIYIYRLNISTLECDIIARFTKDILPMGLFQYGTSILIPDCKEDAIYIYPIGTKKYDGKLCYVDFE